MVKKALPIGSCEIISDKKTYMNNLAKLIAIFLFGLTVTMRSAGQEQHHPGDPTQVFTGEKSSWHGFDRYDFIMDEETLAITPFKSR